MKRRTLWKIVAAFCMVAMLLPTFSALNPVTAESGANPPAPLPYALEFLNQEHPKMYLTEADVTVDGVKNDSEGYVLLTEKTDSDDSSSGIFTSDGSITALTNPASEARPKYLRIYGSYDENGMNFYIEAKSRTHCSTSDPQPQNQSLLTLRFGTTFGTTPADAYAGKNFTFKFTNGDDTIDKSTAALPYKMTKVDNAETVTDSTGTYKLTTATYELKMPWTELGFESFDAVNVDRINFIARYFFLTNGGANYDYWNYALPCNTVLLNRYALAEVYGESITAIPHVLELAGTKPAATYVTKPTLALQSETEKTSDNVNVKMDYALATADNQIAETGILYGNTASIGGKNLVWSEDANKHTATLTDGKATIEHSFAIADYDTFVSFRPYVKYTDGTVIYGEYLTTSPNYMEREAVEFDREINVLMIGCSFNYYYLDELVSMAAEDNIKINANKAYYSGNPANSTWNWLIHDGAYWQEFRHTFDNAGGTSFSNRTLKQILEGGDEKLTWDFISVQDHYGPSTSKSYEACMEKSLPYLANTFRYLEATEPQATLLLHETWAYDKDHSDMKKLSATQETVNEHQANISEAIYKMSETIPASGTVGNYKGMPIVPSGAAWSYARNGVEIDGVTYKIEASSTGILTKDFYHDGEAPGGQFLNACVWYEVLTGNSCIGNTWRPIGYALDEERALALQQIAHQAVADLYGADYATNIPAGRA